MPMQFSSEQMTTDKIHNYNCFKFLQEIKLPNDGLLNNPEINAITILQNNGQYNPQEAYGDLYTRFMTNIENALTKDSLTEQDYDDFFISLYENNNEILEATFAYIERMTLQKSPSSPSLEGVIKHKMRDQGTNINPYSPAQAGSMTGRASALFGPNFKPSHQTSLATVRCYRYNKKNINCPKELRFGTQGQVHFYKSRVSPLFKRFLQAQQRKLTQKNTHPITHVYFNKLARDRSQLSVEGRFETKLTQSLEHLEQESGNVAVITLPADQGIMTHHDIASLKPTQLVVDVKKELLAIALEDSTSTTVIKDFHISQTVRNLLFSNQTVENAELERLLEASFKIMGVTGDTLSLAQRQAVWMHFVNYELPNYIIEKLNPKTFNFSCKDAIDRGGIASAYYNLLSSFATNLPMSREEFEQALHAAPLMVKGRGINTHINIIWNAIDLYITANPNVCQQADKQWLTHWRDANCPSERAGELLERRIVECIADLNNQPQTDLIIKALDTLNSVNQCDRSRGAKHSLWLDTVISTYEFCKVPNAITDEKKLAHYDSLIDTMRECDEQPVSFMEALLRVLIALFCTRKLPKAHSSDYSHLLNKMGQWRQPHESRRLTDAKDERMSLIPKDYKND